MRGSCRPTGPPPRSTPSGPGPPRNRCPRRSWPGWSGRWPPRRARQMTWPVHSTASRLPPIGVDTPMAMPAASMSAPPTSSRLRPKRSPSTPKVSSRTQTGTRNASDIQVSWAELVARSCWKSPLSTAGIASAIWATQTASTAAISVPARMTYIRDGTYVRVLVLLRSSTQPAPTRNHEPPGFGTRSWHHIGALAMIYGNQIRNSRHAGHGVHIRLLTVDKSEPRSPGRGRLVPCRRSW